MGNNLSTEEDKNGLSNIHKIVSHIASEYIFTSNFKDMENLGDVKYCNNLVILTSRIIEENLNEFDVEYITEHIKDGNAVSELTNDKVIYLKKDKIPKLDVKNETQKRRMCVGIARFYVKIAHIFASILKTINPTISYVDNKGNAGETSLFDKHKLPEDADMKMNTISLCSKRLDTLINNNNYDVKNTNDIIVNPRYCDMNSDNATLLDEPGMVELEKLYNDKYDYDTGQYEMSESTKNKYKRDLEKLYYAFSDNSGTTIPPNIKKFGDIKLREHKPKKGCVEGKDGAYRKEYKGKLNDEFFGDYVKHVKKMMDNTKNNQDQLLSVIDKLFVFVNIPNETKKDKKVIMINPTLTEKKLQGIVEETRRIIMNLYITCEKDFLDGLNIFESIVEKQIRETTLNRIKNLQINVDQRANAMLNESNSAEEKRIEEKRDEEKRIEEERAKKERYEEERYEEERAKKERDEEEGDEEEGDEEEGDEEEDSREEDSRKEDHENKKYDERQDPYNRVKSDSDIITGNPEDKKDKDKKDEDKKDEDKKDEDKKDEDKKPEDKKPDLGTTFMNIFTNK
jgi:hypothetical protein